MKIILRYFIPYFRNYKLYFFFVFLGAVATAIGTIGVAEILKNTIDEILIKKDEVMLYLVPSFLVALYIIKGIGRYAQAYFTNYIGQDIVRLLRENLLEHMMHLDMDFFNASRSGELISRLSNDILRIQNVVARIIPEILRDVLIIIGLITYAVYMHYELAFYALVVLPATIIPLAWLAKRMKKISLQSQEKNADVTTRLTEVFNNIEIIKANSTEEFEKQRFAKDNLAFFKINMKGVKTFEFVSPMMEVFGALGIAAILMAGGLAVIRGEMTQGELIGFVTAVGMLYDPIRKTAELFNQMQDAVAATERVSEVFSIKPTMYDGKNAFPDHVHTLRFENVSLNYGEKCALNNISLTFEEGKTYALVGDSGGGKSSFVNLLLRFYDPSAGKIYFNNVDIKSLKLRDLRAHSAMVSQRIYIFQDSLAKNVAYGSEYNEERIKQALSLADADSFVNSLEEGIHTVMEEFGNNLSGGQRQRISIARAIYKDADILILDEATSALDTNSERKIQQAIEKLEKGKTTFTIAHRLTTIEHADVILVFKAGEIVDQGSHDYLQKHSDEYKRLLGTFSA